MNISTSVMIEFNATSWEINETPFSTYLDKFSYHMHKEHFTLGLFSFFPNLFVITSSGLILKSKVQPRSTYMFLGNLALADLIYGIVSLLLYQFQPLIHCNIVCAVVIGLAVSYYMECSFSVCFIAVDRYLFIHHGLHYSKWMTTKRARYMVLATWTFSLILGLVTEVIFADYKEPNEKCNYFIITPTFVLVIVSIVGIFPFLITVVLYILIFLTAFKVSKSRKESKKEKSSNKIAIVSKIFQVTKRKSTTKNEIKKDILYSIKTQKPNDGEGNNLFSFSYTKSHPNTELKIKSIGLQFCEEDFIRKSIQWELLNTQKNNLKTRKAKCFIFVNLLKFLLLITSSFLVAWGPCFTCVAVQLILCSNRNSSEICFNLETVLKYTAMYLVLFNALINPVIYFMFSKGFKIAFLKLFCKNRMRRKRREIFVSSCIRTSLN